MSEIHELSALELGAAIRSGDVSPTEVAEHTSQRADEIGPTVGAFITTTPDLALEQAKVAEEKLRTAARSSEKLSPLCGVPFPIKDLAPVAGIRYTAGSAALKDYVAPVDAGVVQLLREAGTLMVGKTNTPEIGLPPYTEPDVAPPARTPWDLERSAGGSSGGAAAAVASHIVPVAHASDGGGSIRIPASACGLVGLKPSRGLISNGPLDVDGVALSTDGALTRTVRDTAAALDIISKPWPGEVYHLPRPADSYLAACDQDIQPLRIGLLTDPIVVADAPVHPEAIAGAEKVAKVLEGLGHHVERTTPPVTPEQWDPFVAMWATMAASAPIPKENEHLLRPLTRSLRDAGKNVTALELLEAITAAQRITRQTAQNWADFDMIVCPSLAQPPAPVGSIRNDEDPDADFAAQKAFTPWSSLWNITGAPAISLPLHWAKVEGSENELPFGVLIGAGVGQEKALLSLSATLETEIPWKDRWHSLL